MATLPLTALRTFEAVARTGSFQAAAKALFVSQSAISHQIRHLEDWLDQRLFERKGNCTLLLPHGEELAQTLTQSFADMEAACQRARLSGAQQPLIIAAIPSVAMCWLIPRLSDFHAAHPEVDLRIVYALHGGDIDFRDVHIAFVFADRGPTLPGVSSQPFLPGASVPVCSPALFDRLGPAPKHPADIPKLGLLHDGDASGWQKWLGQAGHETRQTLAGPVYEDFNMLRAAALSGQGVALCAKAMIRPDLDTGRLVALSECTVLDDHDYYLLTGPAATNMMAGQVRAFCDWALAARDLSASSLRISRSAAD
ncbi:LysR substrate-binding domain-containing protein [Aliiroseovarius sediminis]|uniref:LysR substrate-binding domain-containing protein n=1 Tax=Aliiroseovarius sediminis TaxID=2925839 RepID=UPI001F59A3B9|nr:LysR substrate-binding domain-containing protein [Aliiroseovarius sediminis]MCI2393764.1 LysR substrate-binding domain-containing protein [Aliiroseovarius sediminis]